MPQISYQTKVIWSLEGKTLNEFSMPELLQQDVAALRLIYHADFSKEILFFLQALKLFRQDHQLQFPVMLDLVSFPKDLFEEEKRQTLDHPLVQTLDKIAQDQLSVFPWNQYLDLNIDYMILPGMASEKIQEIRNKIAYFEPKPWLVVRIDSKDVYAQLDCVLDVCDGVMICRKELSFSNHPATIPMLVKDITQKSYQKAKLVILASDILASMKTNPTPTRAEVSDIANGVVDGCDSVVLSEEVESGPYRNHAYKLCHSIIEDMEKDRPVALNWKREAVTINNELDAISFFAYKTASRLDAKAIVCITKTGNTAMRLASFRMSIPIIAVTFSDSVKRKLALVRGISPLVITSDPALDEVLPLIHDRLKKMTWLKSGDPIVFVTVTLSSMGKEASNLFSIQRVGS